MKIRLKSEETNYVHQRLQMVIYSIAQAKGEALDTKTLRVIYKMKAKFSPNSLDIYLTKAERALILQMLGYRMDILAKAGSISEEAQTIESIMGVIE